MENFSGLTDPRSRWLWLAMAEGARRASARETVERTILGSGGWVQGLAESCARFADAAGAAGWLSRGPAPDTLEPVEGEDAISSAISALEALAVESDARWRLTWMDGRLRQIPEARGLAALVAISGAVWFAEDASASGPPLFIRCARCGRYAGAKRETARFCSTSCRSLASRARGG